MPFPRLFHSSSGAAVEISASRNLLIISKRDPENSPEYSKYLDLCGNHWIPGLQPQPHRKCGTKREQELLNTITSTRRCAYLAVVHCLPILCSDTIQQVAGVKVFAGEASYFRVHPVLVRQPASTRSPIVRCLRRNFDSTNIHTSVLNIGLQTKRHWSGIVSATGARDSL